MQEISSKLGLYSNTGGGGGIYCAVQHVLALNCGLLYLRGLRSLVAHFSCRYGRLFTLNVEYLPWRFHNDCEYRTLE